MTTFWLIRRRLNPRKIQLISRRVPPRDRLEIGSRASAGRRCAGRGVAAGIGKISHGGRSGRATKRRRPKMKASTITRRGVCLGPACYVADAAKVRGNPRKNPAVANRSTTSARASRSRTLATLEISYLSRQLGRKSLTPLGDGARPLSSIALTSRFQNRYAPTNRPADERPISSRTPAEARSDRHGRYSTQVQALFVRRPRWLRFAKGGAEITKTDLDSR